MAPMAAVHGRGPHRDDGIYRVQMTGQFAGLTPDVSAQLRDVQGEHELFLAAFTPEGTFISTPTLTRFTVRYLLEVSEDSAAEADEAAGVEGELLAAQYLGSRGITHKPMTVTPG